MNIKDAINSKRVSACKHPPAEDRLFLWLNCCRCGVLFMDGELKETEIITEEGDIRDGVTRLSSYMYPKD